MVWIGQKIKTHCFNIKNLPNEIIENNILLAVFQASEQQGGMWIPSLLKEMNETEMKNL